MVNPNDIKTIFSFFFKAGMRGKRTRLFFIFSAFPALIFILIRIVAFLRPESTFYFSSLFHNIGGIFYFQLFIQVLSLFFGSAVLNDEIEEKTLVYLTSSPVSRGSIFAGKFLAGFAISGIIVGSGLLVTFVIANFGDLLDPNFIAQLGVFLGAALLAILAYSAFFALLGTLMRKSVMLGILFIFGWESFVQFFPGSTQKLTINHFVKSLLPTQVSGSNNFLSFQLAPSPVWEAILVLLFLAVVCMTLSVFIFYNKEYTLSDHE